MKPRIGSLNPLLVLLAVALVSVLFAVACGGAADPTTAPAEATAEPTEAMAEPTEAMAEPTEAMAEPTEAMAEPTEAMVEPTTEAMMEEEEAQYGGTLRVAYPPDYSAPDPVEAEAAMILDSIEQIFEPLVRINPDASYYPVLATSWEISDDSMSYTFNLREGVTFHNGADFTAEDVLFSLSRSRDPAISTLANKLSAIDDVVAVDDYTVRFDLGVPNGLLLDSLLLYQAVILDSDTDIEKLKAGKPEDVYGTGPFMLDELLPSERVTMVRNPNHWDPKLPYLDELVFVGIEESASRREALLNGDVDVITELEPQQLGPIYTNPDTQVFNVESSSWIGIAINNQIPPFDNKLVRQALRYAIDRDLVNRVAFLGLGAPNNDSPVWPKDSRFYAPEYAAEYDPERARQLLEDAGYPDGIDITINTSDLGPGMLELPVVFRQSAAPAGIRVKIKRHPSAQFWNEIYPVGPLTVFWNAARPEPNHSMTITYHSAEKWAVTYFDKHLVEGAEFSPYGIADWTTGESIFTVGPLALELDGLIERARGESLEQRELTYRQIQAFMADHVPALAIVSRPNLAGAGNDVHGLVLSSVENNVYYNKVWLEQ